MNRSVLSRKHVTFSTISLIESLSFLQKVGRRKVEHTNIIKKEEMSNSEYCKNLFQEFGCNIEIQFALATLL